MYWLVQKVAMNDLELSATTAINCNNAVATRRQARAERDLLRKEQQTDGRTATNNVRRVGQCQAAALRERLWVY